MEKNLIIFFIIGLIFILFKKPNIIQETENFSNIKKLSIDFINNSIDNKLKEYNTENINNNIFDNSENTINYEKLKQTKYINFINLLLNNINTIGTNFILSEILIYKLKEINGNIYTYSIISIIDTNYAITKNLELYTKDNSIINVKEIGNKDISIKLNEPEKMDKIRVFDYNIIENVDYDTLEHDYKPIPFDIPDNAKFNRIERLDKLDFNNTYKINNSKLIKHSF